LEASVFLDAGVAIEEVGIEASTSMPDYIGGA
jgi:hypothetical protein